MQIRRWLIPILLSFILWWLIAPNPNIMLSGIVIVFIAGLLFWAIFRQLNYKWRILMGYGLVGLGISLIGSMFAGMIFPALGIIIGLMIALAYIGLLLLPLYLAVNRRFVALERYVSNLLKFHSRDLTYLLWRANARQELQQYEAALNDYRHGIQLGMNKKRNRDIVVNMYTNRAWILLQRGQIDAALKDINSAIDMNPKAAHAYRVHADILVELDDLEAALESAEYALSLNPKDIHSLTEYAEILARMKRKDESLQTLQAAQKLMPNEVALYTNLASNLLIVGAYEEAIAAVESSMTRTNDTLIRFVLCLNRCVAYRQVGNYDKALAEYENIKDVKLTAPYDKIFSAHVDTEKGIIHFLKQDYAQSRRDFSHSIRTWSPHNLALLCLATAQYSDGEIESAYQTWRRFQETPTRLHNIERLHREGYLPESLLNIVDKIAAEQPAQFFMEQNLSVMRDGGEAAASQK